MNRKLALVLILLSAVLFNACGDSSNDDDDDNNDDASPADDDLSPTDDDNDDASPTDDDDNDDNDDDNDDNNDDATPDDDDDDDTTPFCDWDAYDPLMVTGKAALGDSDPETALTDFAAAAALCPEVGDAQIGQMLARFQALMQTAQTVLADYSTLPLIDWSALQAAIAAELLPLNDELAAAAEIVQLEFPENRLYVPSLPLLWSDDTLVIDGGGEWDYADALNIGALANLFDAMEHFVMAFQLDAEWSLVMTSPYLYDPLEIIHYYTGQLLTMLNDANYPDFLTFTDDGAQHFADFAVSLGFAAIDGQGGFNAVLLETDPQTDDITQYVDDNSNGQWDEGEVFAVPFWGPLGYEMNLLLTDTLVLLGDLGPALLDTGPEDLRPSLPDWLPLGDLNYILAALQAWLPGLTLPDLPIPVGRWFYNPPDDGLRTVMTALVQWLYDYTAPKK